MTAPGPELLGQIQLHRRWLDTICGVLKSALDEEIARLGRTRISALIVASLLEN